MTTYTCETCGSTTATHVVEREETLPVKGEDITVTARVRVCDTCGEEIYDEELDNATLVAAFDIYRRRHNILTPSEIRSLRECYGLSQRGLALLLGLGEVTIHRYESGSLPDEAQNQLLQFIQDPWNMQELFERNGNRLPPAVQRKLAERLDTIIWEITPDRVVNLVAAKYREPSLLTGFRRFSPEVLMEMMIIFASLLNGVFKTKLNKLLWYADFTHYRQHAVSISGATYIHLQYGPVPDDWAVYINRLTKDGALRIEEVPFASGDTGEKLCAMREPNLDILPSEALAVIKAVATYFTHWTSKKISDFSHQEAGYVETQEGEPISYAYAERLKVDIPLLESNVF